MRVLLLNWRDTRSPGRGGAEHVTHEVARRLVGLGHEVTWLSSTAATLPAEETLDGVRIVRRGSELTTRRFARQLARAVRPDVILEEINTLPYFAPLWSAAPVVLYMNQLARDVWWYEAPFPLALVGWLAEPLYLQAYRRCSAVTISPSTRDDLHRIGIRGPILIAPMAPDVTRLPSLPERTAQGRMIAIGRLTPSKRFDHAIRALSQLRGVLPGAKLTLVGDGRSRDSLAALSRELGVSGAVEFTGRVDEAEKLRLLDAADVLVGTSVREGWGLTVSEAAARGLPSVVYDIPGFRDSVVDGRTGFVVSPNPAALADGVSRLVADGELYDRLRRAAWAGVDGETYDAAAATFVVALEQAIAGRGISRSA